MTYAYLCLGKDQAGIDELDRALAPDEEALEETIDRANARAMAQMGIGMVGPPPKPKAN